MVHVGIALVLSLLVPLQEPPPKVLRKKTALLIFDVQESSGIREKRLHISRDGKKSWLPAEQAGLSGISWGEFREGKITVRVSFPSDGDYHIYAQFGDSAENLTSPPAAGGRHHEFVRVVTDGSAPPGGVEVQPASGGIQLLHPRVGDSLVAGSRVVVEWKTPAERDVVSGSVTLYYRSADLPWQVIFEKLELTGTRVWTVPTTARGVLWVRVSARGRDGREMFQDSGRIEVRGGPSPIPPTILEPKGGELWKAGETVKIRWSAGEGNWVTASTVLSYSVGDGPWKVITKGLENTGFYLWSPPQENSDRLRIQVRMRAVSGDTAETASAAVRVRASERGDKKTAMMHYDRARVLHAQKRMGEAIAEYEKSMAAWPSYPEPVHEMGRLYYEQGEYARALEYFLRAGELSPSLPQPYVNRASAQLRLGLLNEAYADLLDAVDLGVDRDARLAVTCGEKLLEAAVRFAAAERSDLASEACRSILRIRGADSRARRQAQDYLDWIAQETSAVPKRRRSEGR